MRRGSLDGAATVLSRVRTSLRDLRGERGPGGGDSRSKAPRRAQEAGRARAPERLAWTTEIREADSRRTHVRPTRSPPGPLGPAALDPLRRPPVASIERLPTNGKREPRVGEWRSRFSSIYLETRLPNGHSLSSREIASASRELFAAVRPIGASGSPSPRDGDPVPADAIMRFDFDYETQ
jgi:hypothetical protein